MTNIFPDVVNKFLDWLLCCAEGVLQAEKDFNLASHPEIEGIPNLQVQHQAQ